MRRIALTLAVALARWGAGAGAIRARPTDVYAPFAFLLRPGAFATEDRDGCGATEKRSKHEGVIVLHAPGAKKPQRRVEKLPAHVVALAASPDGKLAGAGLEDGTIRIVRIDAAKSVKTLGEKGSGAVETLAFSRDGKPLASAARDGTTFVWTLD